MARTNRNIVIEHAHIWGRNFSGIEKPPYNKEGDRNFCVELDDIQLARQLAEEGWNIKFRDPNEQYPEPSAYVQVKVKYGKLVPEIYMVGDNGTSTLLNEETVGLLDSSEIENVDLVIRPYNYDVRGEQGVSAYVKTMYVTLAKDPFYEKYHRNERQPITVGAGDDELPFDISEE